MQGEQIDRRRGRDSNRRTLSLPPTADGFNWSGGQGVSLRFPTQGRASYFWTTAVFQNFIGNCGVAGSASHFDGCLLKGSDSARSCFSSGTTIPSSSSSHSGQKTTTVFISPHNQGIEPLPTHCTMPNGLMRGQLRADTGRRTRWLRSTFQSRRRRGK
jgi:hypothetical protein